MFTNMKLPVVIFLVYNVLSSSEALKEGECEVCQKVLQDFSDSLEDGDRVVNTMTEKFKSLCSTFNTPLRSKEERLCYYVGGLEISSTSILPSIMTKMKNHIPVEKICQDLKKTDSQICELKFEKQIDLATADFKKLKVKDLKKILEQWGESGACKGCAEKSDFVRVIKELMPKHDPKAHKQREEL